MVPTIFSPSFFSTSVDVGIVPCVVVTVTSHVPVMSAFCAKAGAPVASSRAATVMNVLMICS